MFHVAQNAQIPDVPRACGGTITDATLADMINLARDLEHNRLTHEGGTLLLQNLRGVLEELAHRRRVMSLVHDVSAPDNVIFLDQK